MLKWNKFSNVVCLVIEGGNSAMDLLTARDTDESANKLSCLFKYKVQHKRILDESELPIFKFIRLVGSGGASKLRFDGGAGPFHGRRVQDEAETVGARLREPGQGAPERGWNRLLSLSVSSEGVCKGKSMGF